MIDCEASEPRQEQLRHIPPVDLETVHLTSRQLYLLPSCPLDPSEIAEANPQQ